MNFNGLSLDQAPPIQAPLRFFLTAPLFGILAGFLLFFSDTSALMSRYSVESIALTHTITIGFFSFVMLGALTQMLPVLAGVKMKYVQTTSNLSHVALVVGLSLMIFGLLKVSSFALHVASALLFFGFLGMGVMIALAIKDVSNFTATVKNMALSLAFMFFILLMGVFMLEGYASSNISALHVVVANIHSVWAVFGFAGLLIIGVSFQILPMFYVAPRFKRFCKKRVAWLIVTGLFLWGILNILQTSYDVVAKVWIALFFWAFATTVWKKLNERKRAVSDITVWYWRSASVFLTIGSFFWVFDDYFEHRYTVLVALFVGGGFIFSIIMGMLYKIIPFLVWFHLNAKGYMSIPTMNEMIDKKLSKLQFGLFMLSLVGFVVSFFMPSLLEFFAVLFILSMVVLELNIVAPVKLYLKTIKTKPDFDMSAFS